MKAKVIFLLFVTLSAWCQAQQYVEADYYMENALRSREIQCIEIDSLGYIWIQTNMRFLRFDGKYFQTLRPNNAVETDYSSAKIIDIVSGSAEYVYFLDSFSIFAFNQISHDFHRLNTSDAPSVNNDNQINGMFHWKPGILIFWDEGAMYKFKESDFSVEKLFDLARATKYIKCTENSEGALLILCNDELMLYNSNMESPKNLMKLDLKEHDVKKIASTIQDQIVLQQKRSLVIYSSKGKKLWSSPDSLKIIDFHKTKQQMVVLGTESVYHMFFNKSKLFLEEIYSLKESINQGEIVSRNDVMYLCKPDGFIRIKKSDHINGPLLNLGPTTASGVDSTFFLKKIGKSSFLAGNRKKLFHFSIESLFQSSSIISSYDLQDTLKSLLFMNSEGCQYAANDYLGELNYRTGEIQQIHSAGLNILQNLLLENYQVEPISEDLLVLRKDSTVWLYNRSGGCHISIPELTDFQYYLVSNMEGTIKFASDVQIISVDAECLDYTVGVYDFLLEEPIIGALSTCPEDLLLVGKKDGVTHYFGSNVSYEGRYRYFKNLILNNRHLESIYSDVSGKGIWASLNDGFAFLNFEHNRTVEIPKSFFSEVSQPHSDLIPVDSFKALLLYGREVYMIDATTEKPDKPAIHSVKDIGSSYLYNPEIRLSEKNRPFTFEFRHIDHQSDGRSNRIQYKFENDSEWIDLEGKKSDIVSYLPSGYNMIQTRVITASGLMSDINAQSIYVSKDFFKAEYVIPVLAVLASLLAFFLMRSHAKKLNRLKELEIKHRQISDLKLKALNAQMKPHFMFNCLNSIRSFVLQNDSEKAADYLSDFSHFIRSVLKYGREPLITLKNEVSFLEEYLALEQMRLEQKIDLHIAIDDRLSLNQVFSPH